MSYRRLDNYGDRAVNTSELSQKLKKSITCETDGSVAIAETAFFNAGEDGKARTQVSAKSIAVLMARSNAVAQILKDAANDEYIELSLTLINDDDSSGANGNTVVTRRKIAKGGKGLGEQVLHVVLPDYHVNKISGTLTISSTLAGQLDGLDLELYLVQN